MNFLFNASILAYKAQISVHSNVPVIGFIHRNYYIVANLLLVSVTAPHWLLHQLIREFREAIVLLLPLDLCLLPAYFALQVLLAGLRLWFFPLYVISVPDSSHLLVTENFALTRSFHSSDGSCYSLFSYWLLPTSLCSQDPHLF